MKQSNSQPAIGHTLPRFFQYAMAALMLVAFSGAALAEKVNLNTADAQTLQYIPGIGPGKSEDIVRLREEIGGFTAMEDLLSVSGIGEKTLIGIKKFGSLRGGMTTLTEEMQANPPRLQPATKNAHKVATSG